MKFSVCEEIVKTTFKQSLILAVTQDGKLSVSGESLPQGLTAYIQKLITKGDFSGELGATFLLPQSDMQPFEHLLLIGCGKTSEVTLAQYKKLLQTSVRFFYSTKATQILSSLHTLDIEDRDVADKLQLAVVVLDDALYQFHHYKSEKKTLHHIKAVNFLATKTPAVKRAIANGQTIANGVNLTKDLANQPSNICTPNYLAQEAKALAKVHTNLKVTVIDEAGMKKLGMGAFLAVAQGSDQEAKLITLEYKSNIKKAKTVCVVGKGITFDTGGLSLKPADAMVGMKYDMCGAATVMGVMRAVAELKLPINVVGLMATSENMPSGHAAKPEDIVTSMSGQTIEIMNTDAEGRLVLCDTLTYAERFKPDAVIDIATLTGAVVIALGHHATGLLANDDALAKGLLTAGEQAGDRAWQLPLWDEYQAQLKSPFADMSNVGGRAAGTITAACFLSKFAKKFKWAHLDVAGTAAMMGGNDRYATGRPVPLLVQYLLNVAEPKTRA